MEAIVYDPKLWGPRDIGNNAHCWKLATILRQYKDKDGRKLVDVRFHYDGHVSHGHFEDVIREADPTKPEYTSGSFVFQDLKALRSNFDSDKYVPYTEGESEESYRERCAKWCEKKTGAGTAKRVRATCHYCTQYKRLRKTTLEVARLLPKEMQRSFSEIVELVEDEIHGHFGDWGHHFSMDPE